MPPMSKKRSACQSACFHPSFTTSANFRDFRDVTIFQFEIAKFDLKTLKYYNLTRLYTILLIFWDVDQGPVLWTSPKIIQNRLNHRKLHPNSYIHTLHNIQKHNITLQYITIHYNYNTLQYITIHHNTSQYITIHDNTWQYMTIHDNTWQYSTIHYNTIQYITIHYNTLQYVTIRYNTLHYVTIDYNRLQ